MTVSFIFHQQCVCDLCFYFQICSTFLVKMWCQKVAGSLIALTHEVSGSNSESRRKNKRKLLLFWMIIIAGIYYILNHMPGTVFKGFLCTNLLLTHNNSVDRFPHHLQFGSWGLETEVPCAWRHSSLAAELGFESSGLCSQPSHYTISWTRMKETSLCFQKQL